MGENEGEAGAEKLKLKRTALLIDIENLIRTTQEIGLPTDVSRIVEKLLESSRLAIRRSYGDMDAAVRGNWDLKRQVRTALVDNLVQIQDLPNVGQKNSSDIKLAVDALAIAYDRVDIEQFAIVSSDRDYVPLILKLRELGREVIGIGTSPDTVNQLYVRACDRFLYYSSLFRTAAPAAKENDLVQDQAATLDAYLQLLCEAIESLDQQGKTASGGQIVPLLRQKRPDYDPALVGLKSFRDLVEAAKKRGLIDYKTSGMDVIVRLADKGAASIPAAAAPRAPGFDPDDRAGSYGQFFHQKLKCEIPSQEDRAAIYDATAEVLGTLHDGSMELDDLSWAVADRLDQKATKAAIFKILYGLFRGQVFRYFPSEQPFNPKIAGAEVPRAEWDGRFVTNCLKVLGRERPDWPVDLAALAAALHVDAGTVEAALKALE